MDKVHTIPDRKIEKQHGSHRQRTIKIVGKINHTQLVIPIGGLFLEILRYILSIEN